MASHCHCALIIGWTPASLDILRRTLLYPFLITTRGNSSALLSEICFQSTSSPPTAPQPSCCSTSCLSLLPGTSWTNLSSPAESIRIERTLQPGLDRIVVGQMWLAILSWSTLAVVMARRVKNPFLKILVVALILGFAYSPNLADWDSILLSESIALSLFALMVAATLELAPRLLEERKLVKLATVGTIIVWALTMVFWVFSRDTNSYILLVMLAPIAGLLLFPRTRQVFNFRLMLFIALFLSGLFTFQNRTLAASDRWVNPFFNNMLYNVFPYPERVAYFEQQGMLITEEVLAFRDGPPNQDGFWEIPYLMDWVYAEGYSTYSRFLITHPTYTVQKVFGNFPLVFLENEQPFFPADFDHTPRWFYYVGNLLHPLSGSVMLIVVLLTGMLGWRVWSHLSKHDVGIVGIFAILVSGLFTMLAVSILGDGLSIIRHAMVAVVPFRLFMWLLVMLVVDRLLLPNAAAWRD